MSEPMSNHEIEDVLSSIRRLVSDDLRPAPRQNKVVQPPEAAEKLLLTPALRVVDPADSGVSEEEATDFAADADDDHYELADIESDAEVDDRFPEDRFDSDLASVASVDDVVSKLGAAVGEGDSEWESPVGDLEDWTDAGWTGSRRTAPIDLAELNKTVENLKGRGRLHLGVASMHPAPEPDFIDPPEDSFDPDAAAMPDVDVVSDTVPDMIKSAAAPRVVTPPGRGAGSWADVAEAAVMADLAQDVEDKVDVTGLFEEPTGGMLFDEDVLRELVRDMIREELAGTLGERITRNVRKLVRAEIARALAVHEFE